MAQSVTHLPSRSLSAAVLGVGVMLGVAIAVGGTTVALLLASALFLPLVLGPRRLRVVAMSVLLVALVNGLPGIDLASMNSSGSFNFQDPVLLLLFAIGGYELVVQSGQLKGLIPRWVGLLLVVFSTAWLFGVASGTVQGTPLLASLLFGRDLLAVWLVAVIALAARDRTDVGIVLGVIVGASAIYSLAHIAQVGLGVDTSIITHPKRTTDTLGFDRLYASMIPLTTFGFFASVGYSLWGRSPRIKVASVTAVGIIGVEQLLQLTRANYVALAVALLAGSVAAFATGSVRWGAGRAGNALIGLSAALLGGWALSLSSFVDSSIWVSVQNRILSTASDVSRNAGNVGFRIIEYAAMLRVLGNRWVFGLGFQHPQYHWFPTLLDGSIRNSDLGVLSVLMPIGLVGLVPLLLLGVGGVLRGLHVMRRDDALVRIVAWSCFCTLIVGLVSAPSLGYFSTLPGLLTTACAIGLLCRVMWQGFAPIESAGGDVS